MNQLSLYDKIIHIKQINALYIDNPVTEKIIFHPVRRTLEEVAQQLRVLAQTRFADNGELRSLVEAFEEVLNRLHSAS